MKKFKKILLCICLLFVCVMSFGCSTVTMHTTLKNNGAIVASFDIDLSEMPTDRRKVYQVVKEYYHQLDKAYEENMLALFSNLYTDNEAFVNDTSTASKLSYIATRNSNYLVSDTTQIPTEDNLGECKFVYLEKTFASIYAYLFYFYPNAFEYNEQLNKVKVKEDYHSLVDIPFNSTYEEESGLFVDKIIQTCNPFYYNGKEPEFLYSKTIIGSGLTLNVAAGDKLVDKLAEATGKTAEEVELVFSFSTPYKRVYSDGAFSQTQEGYTHTWQLDNVNSTIKLWRNYANYLPWYVVAGVAVVLGTIIAFVVVFIIQKAKQNKGMKALKKIAELENKNTNQNNENKK